MFDTEGPAAGPRFTRGKFMTGLDDARRPVAPGAGVVGRLARRGHIPLSYYKDDEKTAATFVTAADGARRVVPGDLAVVETDGTITLLGQSVDVEATPTSFAWHYGDGTSATTSTPGAPYPAKDITHNYTDAHITVAPSVDVTYAARFRVGNGGWQTIPETVTIPGPTSSLRISEATAVLSGDY